MPATDEAQREERQNVIAGMAEKAGVTPERMMEAIRRRVAKEAQVPDLLLFLHTANTYGLDPLATPPQIALFVPKNKDGGVPKPYVTFDGWLRILISHPLYIDHWWDDEVWSGGQRGKGTLDAVTFYIKRKARDGGEPIVFPHTELLAECREKGEWTPWNKWPSRMLKEKAAMQGTRFCFSMYVPDLDDLRQAEAMETAKAEAIEATPQQGPIAPAAPIAGARKRKESSKDRAPDPAPPGLPEPKPTQTVDEFLHGKSEPVPAVAETNQANPETKTLFPETPGRAEPASLPAFDPAESARVDKALAEEARKADGLFDDIL